MEVVDTLGPLFLGLMFDALLFGAVAMQAGTYFRHSGTDSTRLTVVVSVACLLGVLQLALTGHTNYYILIMSSNRPKALLKTVWSLNVEIIVTVIITFLVRCYLTATRVWQLSGRNKWLVSVILLLLIAQLALGIGMGALTFIKQDFAELPHFFAVLVVQMGSAALSDFIITASLVYYLHNSRTGIPKTESMINRLIAWSVNTCVVTGIIELALLISWIRMPHTLIFVAFHLVVGQVYTLALLTMLNYRRFLRSDMDAHTHIYSTASSGTVMVFRSRHVESGVGAEDRQAPRKPWLRRPGSRGSTGGTISASTRDRPKRARPDVSVPKQMDWSAPAEWHLEEIELASTSPSTTASPRSSMPNVQ